MRRNPERLAWRILLAAFLTFLLLCGSVIYAVQWYLFRSTIGLQVDLAAARGTVIVMLPGTQEEIAVSSRRDDLGAGATIRTDGTSQALLTFSDPKTGLPVASLVLLRDSEVTIVRASAPRFGLNKAPLIVAIGGHYGHSEFVIFGNTGQNVSFSLISPQARVTASESGHYMLDITDQDTRVTARRGEAQVTDLLNGHTVTLAGGEATLVDLSGSGELPVLEAELSLLVNGDFAEPYSTGWNFYTDGEPAGMVLSTVFNGLPALILDRSQENWPGTQLGHGETRLFQDVNTDVTGYSYLELRSTFYVEEQSLSTCGIEGSECPLMLRMDYMDVTGTERTYIHGFFAYHDPALNFPLACASCRNDHERINMQTWYTFRTGNLLAILPPEQQPAFIRQVSFYASGHAYKVYVTEVELLAVPE